MTLWRDTGEAISEALSGHLPPSCPMRLWADERGKELGVVHKFDRVTECVLPSGHAGGHWWSDGKPTPS